MKRSLLFEFSFLALLACLVSCKHEVPQPMLVEDTTGNGPGSGIPCDSNTVYFEQQILPILISNCSQPGCHNAASAQDGVVLTNYSSIISTVLS